MDEADLFGVQSKAAVIINIEIFKVMEITKKNSCFQNYNAVFLKKNFCNFFLQ